MWSLKMNMRRMLSLGSSLLSWRLLRNRQVTKAGLKACNEHLVQGNCERQLMLTVYVKEGFRWSNIWFTL